MSNVAFAIPLSTVEEAEEDKVSRETELADEEEEDESVVFWPPTSSTFAFRMCLLIIAAVIPFGAHVVKYELTPLGPLLLADPSLELSKTEFNALQSAISIPNLFFPLLAGLWVDYRGSKTATLCCLLLTLFSHVCFIFSLITRSFASAFFFHILFGAGQGGSVVAQTRIASRYFLGHELIMAISILEASHSLAIFLGTLSTLPIASYFGTYLYSLWFGAGYCLLSLVLGVVLFWLVRHELDSGKASDEHVQKLLEAIPSIRRASGNGSVSLRQRQSSLIAMPAAGNKKEWTMLAGEFVLLAFIHLLFSNCSHWFLLVLANLQVSQWNFTLSSSAMLSALAAASSVLLCPALGWLLDHKGRKIHIVSIACVVSSLAYSILSISGVSVSLTLFALLILAVTSTLVPTILRASVAHIVPSAFLGSAFGLYQMSEALGAVIGRWAVPYLRSSPQASRSDLWVFAGVSIAAAVLSVGLSFLDGQRGGRLNSPSVEKDETQEEEARSAKTSATEEDEKEMERRKNSVLYSQARDRAAAIFAKHAAGSAAADNNDNNEEQAPLLLRVDAPSNVSPSPSPSGGYGATLTASASASSLSPSGIVSNRSPSTLSGGGSARSSLTLPQHDHEHIHERSTSWTLEIANQKPKLYPRRRRSWMKSQTIPYLAVKRKPSVSPNPSPTVAMQAATIKEAQK